MDSNKGHNPKIKTTFQGYAAADRGLCRLPGLQIGYEHSFVHQVADFLKGLETGQPTNPTFRDALVTQKVCDAVLSSAAQREWVELV